MAATLQINPVWLRGPYDPSKVGAGSQPDWYMAFLEGALRLMPPWEIGILGHELTLSVLVPAILLPGIIVTALAMYPWIEQKIIGAEGDQHILDRPRNLPARTGLGAAFLVFYVLLWIAGGNDVIATVFHISVTGLTRFLQISVVVLPPLAYSITKRICLGLQRRDRDKVLHGRETGIIVVSPVGGFSEVRLPPSRYDLDALTSHAHRVPIEPEPEIDENGIPAPRRCWPKLRARLSMMYFGDLVDRPTTEEISAARHHSGHVPAAPTRPGVGKEPQQ